MEAEKEELSEEIAALQQERDEGLLLAESEKQQVRELEALWGSPTSAQHIPTQQLGVQEAASFFLGLGSHLQDRRVGGLARWQ